MDNTNYYNVLEIPNNATVKDIATAYFSKNVDSGGSL
jgi:curved DNA-binding protein CbpA